VFRSSVTGRRIGRRDDRPPEQIREHYDLERALAKRLRDSPTDKRGGLYGAVYGELYSRLPHHPMMARSESERDRASHARPSLRTLRPYLERASSMVEVGPGDCGVSIEAARQVKHVYAIDVADQAVRTEGWPPNLEYLLFDGLRLPLPDSSCDLAFSNQVIEHLHPDDAVTQLRELHRVLAPGGKLVCIVPNRTTGPHDVSAHFDTEATGFHLNEVTMRGLVLTLHDAGFGRVRAIARVGGIVAEYPPAITGVLEKAFEVLPHQIARRLGHSIPAQKLGLHNVTLVAVR
jgi:ubiquinone/menaquinone biosynthesis C-methylase UbiE